MKKILLAATLCLLTAIAYALGTLNASRTITIPPAAWAEGSEAAHAWRQFVISLEAGGARVFAANKDPQQRLDGLVYLAQLATASLEMKLAKGDTLNPRFTDWMSDYRKFLGDSPDAIYHTAEISAEFEYEITGNIGDAEYLGLMIYGKGVNNWNRAAANISNENIVFDESGNFTIILSNGTAVDPDTNWLQLEQDSHMVMVRQYYHGRSGKNQAKFTIRNLEPPANAQLTENEIASKFASATTFFNNTLDGAIALVGMLAGSPNSIDPPKSYSPDFGGVFYPTSDNLYYGSWFTLEDDEALIVEGAVPDAPYWGVSLQNRWLQSLDYEYHPVALNDHEIHTENGRYQIVVSHRRPPSDNWLSTTGNREGLLSIRYQQAKDSEKPSLKVVKFDELKMRNR